MRQIPLVCLGNFVARQSLRSFSSHRARPFARPFDFGNRRMRRRSTASLCLTMSFPGEILCHGETPDVCGRGMRSKEQRFFCMEKLRPIDIFQFHEGNEPRDGKTADWNNEMRAQDSELVVYP